MRTSITGGGGGRGRSIVSARSARRQRENKIECLHVAGSAIYL